MIAMALACRPEAAHRRRADDRARRDDPGADPGAARRAAARDRHGAAVHHARLQPRRASRHRVGVMEKGTPGRERLTRRGVRASARAYTGKLLASRPQRMVQPVAADAPVLLPATMSASTSTRAKAGSAKRTLRRRRDATLALQPRRDARHRRRIGLRQDDARHGAAALQPIASGGRSTRRTASASTTPSRATLRAMRRADAGRVPGSVRFAQPAHDHRADRRRRPGAAHAAS